MDRNRQLLAKAREDYRRKNPQPAPPPAPSRGFLDPIDLRGLRPQPGSAAPFEQRFGANMAAYDAARASDYNSAVNAAEAALRAGEDVPDPLLDQIEGLAPRKPYLEALPGRALSTARSLTSLDAYASIGEGVANFVRQAPGLGSQVAQGVRDGSFGLDEAGAMLGELTGAPALGRAIRSNIAAGALYDSGDFELADELSNRQLRRTVAGASGVLPTAALAKSAVMAPIATARAAAVPSAIGAGVGAGLELAQDRGPDAGIMDRIGLPAVGAVTGFGFANAPRALRGAPSGPAALDDADLLAPIGGEREASARGPGADAEPELSLFDKGMAFLLAPQMAGMGAARRAPVARTPELDAEFINLWNQADPDDPNIWINDYGTIRQSLRDKGFDVSDDFVRLRAMQLREEGAPIRARSRGRGVRRFDVREDLASTPAAKQQVGPVFNAEDMADVDAINKATRDELRDVYGFPEEELDLPRPQLAARYLGLETDAMLSPMAARGTPAVGNQRAAARSEAIASNPIWQEALDVYKTIEAKPDLQDRVRRMQSLAYQVSQKTGVTTEEAKRYLRNMADGQPAVRPRGRPSAGAEIRTAGPKTYELALGGRPMRLSLRPELGEMKLSGAWADDLFNRVAANEDIDTIRRETGASQRQIQELMDGGYTPESGGSSAAGLLAPIGLGGAALGAGYFAGDAVAQDDEGDELDVSYLPPSLTGMLDSIPGLADSPEGQMALGGAAGLAGGAALGLGLYGFGRGFGAAGGAAFELGDQALRAMRKPAPQRTPLRFEDADVFRNPDREAILSGRTPSRSMPAEARETAPPAPVPTNSTGDPVTLGQAPVRMLLPPADGARETLQIDPKTLAMIRETARGGKQPSPVAAEQKALEPADLMDPIGLDGLTRDMLSRPVDAAAPAVGAATPLAADDGIEGVFARMAQARQQAGLPPIEGDAAAVQRYAEALAQRRALREREMLAEQRGASPLPEPPLLLQDFRGPQRPEPQWPAPPQAGFGVDRRTMAALGAGAAAGAGVGFYDGLYGERSDPLEREIQAGQRAAFERGLPVAAGMALGAAPALALRGASPITRIAAGTAGATVGGMLGAEAAEASTGGGGGDDLLGPIAGLGAVAAATGLATRGRAPRNVSPLGFYSALEDTIANSKTARASADQWLSTLSKAPGVKREEIKQTGLENWLNQQDGKIARDDILAFARENAIKVEEVVYSQKNAFDDQALQRRLLPIVEERNAIENELIDLIPPPDDLDDVDDLFDPARSDDPDRARWLLARDEALRLQEDAIRMEMSPGADQTKWSSFTLPGGEDYTERLLKVSGSKDLKKEYQALEAELSQNPTPERQAQILQQQADLMRTSASSVFQDSHWQEPNVFAHMRYKVRKTPTGKRFRASEEFQSDWDKKGRTVGYKSNAPDLRPEDIRIEVRDGKMFGVGPDGSEVDGGAFNVSPGESAAVEDFSPEWVRHNFSGFATVEDALESQRYAVQREVAEGSAFATDEIDRLQKMESYAGAVRSSEAKMRDFAAAILNSRKNRANQRGVPPMPFNKNKWASTLLKRLITLAVENGDDGVAWIPGNIQNGKVVDASDNRAAFYDQIMVNIANDLGKKYGAKVSKEIMDGVEFHTMEITPEMRATVKKDGLPLLGIGVGALGGGLVGAALTPEDAEASGGGVLGPISGLSALGAAAGTLPLWARRRPISEASMLDPSSVKGIAIQQMGDTVADFERRDVAAGKLGRERSVLMDPRNPSTAQAAEGDNWHTPITEAQKRMIMRERGLDYVHNHPLTPGVPPTMRVGGGEADFLQPLSPTDLDWFARMPSVDTMSAVQGANDAWSIAQRPPGLMARSRLSQFQDPDLGAKLPRDGGGAPLSRFDLASDLASGAVLSDMIGSANIDDVVMAARMIDRADPNAAQNARTASGMGVLRAMDETGLMRTDASVPADPAAAKELQRMIDLATEGALSYIEPRLKSLGLPARIQLLATIGVTGAVAQELAQSYDDAEADGDPMLAPMPFRGQRAAAPAQQAAR